MAFLPGSSRLLPRHPAGTRAICCRCYAIHAKRSTSRPSTAQGHGDRDSRVRCEQVVCAALRGASVLRPSGAIGLCCRPVVDRYVAGVGASAKRLHIRSKHGIMTIGGTARAQGRGGGISRSAAPYVLFAFNQDFDLLVGDRSGNDRWPAIPQRSQVGELAWRGWSGCSGRLVRFRLAPQSLFPLLPVAAAHDAPIKNPCESARKLRGFKSGS